MMVSQVPAVYHRRYFIGPAWVTLQQMVLHFASYSSLLGFRYAFASRKIICDGIGHVYVVPWTE